MADLGVKRTLDRVARLSACAVIGQRGHKELYGMIVENLKIEFIYKLAVKTEKDYV